MTANPEVCTIVNSFRMLLTVIVLFTFMRNWYVIVCVQDVCERNEERRRKREREKKRKLKEKLKKKLASRMVLAFF